MLNMQNLKSQSSDSIVASGKFTGKKSEISKDGVEGFLKLLNNAAKTADNKDALGKISNSTKDISKKTKKTMFSASDSNKDVSQNDGVIEKVEMPDNGKKDQNLLKGTEESGTISTGIQLLDIMAQVAGNLNLSQVYSEATDEIGNIEGESQGVSTKVLINQELNGVVDQNTFSGKNIVKEVIPQESNLTGNFKEIFFNEVKNETTEINDLENFIKPEEPLKANTATDSKTGIDKILSNTNGEKILSSDDKNISSSEIVKNKTNAEAIKPDLNLMKEDRVEVVTVKVGDGEKLTQQFTSNIANTISSKMGDGIREFTILVNPKHLGRIEIKIAFMSGKAHVMMTASHEAAHRLLLGNESAIKQIIESNTGHETSVTLRHNEETNANHRDESRQNNQERHDQNQKDREQSENKSTDSFIQQFRLGLVNME